MAANSTFTGGWVRVLMTVGFILFPLLVDGSVRRYNFNVVRKQANRLCSSKPIVTVNGQFPGPTLYAREGDTMLVRVVNKVKYNVSIHWHGIRQLRTGWADGPAYITQCPIQPGQNYVYNFTITGQRGTLFWHAHILWLRATVHGAVVILPKLGVPYPYPKPDVEQVVILGEWWKSDTEKVINEALKSGLAPNVSDAHTINGHPGPITSCQSQGGYQLSVENGKSYMLRIINAALNEELFFKIAGHKLTVVEVDATYVKPFTTDTIVIAPGQTTNAIITASKSSGKFMMAASPFMDSPIAVDNKTATATLHYTGTLTTTSTTLTIPPPQNSTATANNFINSLRSLNSKKFPANVPLKIDHSLYFAVGLGINPCPTCKAGNGSRVVADINNVTFVMPTTALLQAHYFNKKGVFTTDFPGNPPVSFNYTGAPPTNLATSSGTKVAIRFRADNPGVWFMHCHLEVHTTWGLKMAFLVDNGNGPNESILPPPKDLPKC
ncbi:hypothetical protein L1987_50272 [Smallanthus sonchifolius]|uniref:Uncharacterized protein n=1 Tax=Smallanthus sonchifolius TaxID=185202 RepID=A0ACB9EMV0_9ASTR|nr:hypothetical protein L1987_50272 [Smallanthus sonchifolius]